MSKRKGINMQTSHVETDFFKPDSNSEIVHDSIDDSASVWTRVPTINKNKLRIKLMIPYQHGKGYLKSVKISSD